MQKDGLTYGQHLKAIAERSEWARRELAGPAFPEALGHVWEYFCAVAEGRTYLYRGERLPVAPMPLSWTEIRSWAALTRRRLRTWEVELIRALDRAWLVPPKPGGADEGERKA